MRKITHIIIHCAATKPSMDIDAAEIDKWHRKRGFFGIGYHYVIRRSGEVENGRPLDQPGAHAQGHNKNSIGICLVGGLDDSGNPEANYTPAQWDALKKLVDELCQQFPGVHIIGHNEVATKACPCFNVQEWLANN